MTSLIFPDVNVWIALPFWSHTHIQLYKERRGDEQPAFCRFTQLAYLRLATTESVAGKEIVNQIEAWRKYDQWLDGAAVFLEERLV